MWGMIRKWAGEGHFCHHAHRPKVFVLFSCISIWEDLGSSGKQGPVEANRSYLNHQFSPVRLAVYLRFIGHLDQCSFRTRWRKLPVYCEVRVRTRSEECLEWKGVSEKKGRLYTPHSTVSSRDHRPCLVAAKTNSKKKQTCQFPSHHWLDESMI